MEIVDKKNDAALLAEKRIGIFRWYFYIALLQLIMYFAVPAFVFPRRFIIDIEIISALTLGMVVCAFFLLVNVLGFFLDKSRRVLYASFLSIMVAYFTWVIISWSFIERMDYLLR
jgi:hypothetical protein